MNPEKDDSFRPDGITPDGVIESSKSERDSVTLYLGRHDVAKLRKSNMPAADEKHGNVGLPWATQAGTDNFSPNRSDFEYYQRRIGILLNFDALSARTFVGAPASDVGVQLGPQVSHRICDPSRKVIGRGYTHSSNQMHASVPRSGEVNRTFDDWPNSCDASVQAYGDDIPGKKEASLSCAGRGCDPLHGTTSHSMRSENMQHAPSVLSQASFFGADTFHNTTTGVFPTTAPFSVDGAHGLAAPSEQRSSTTASIPAAAPIGSSPSTSSATPPIVRRTNSVARLCIGRELLREMHDCFVTFDRNNDYSIAPDELGDVMRMLGLDHTAEQVQEMIRAVDKNANGRIEFGEFVEIMKEQWGNGEVNKGLSSTDDEVTRIFKVFDKNNDGKISPEELRMVMSHLGEELSDEDLATMMAAADLDGDGQIDLNEFRNIVLLAATTAAIPPAATAAAATLTGGNPDACPHHQHNHSHHLPQP